MFSLQIKAFSVKKVDIKHYQDKNESPQVSSFFNYVMLSVRLSLVTIIYFNRTRVVKKSLTDFDMVILGVNIRKYSL